MQKIAELAAPEEVKYDVAEDPVILYTEEGRDRVRIKSKILKRYTREEPRTEFHEGLVVEFYGRGNDKTVLTADYGLNHDQKKIMMVQGNVRMINPDNEILETEELTWDERKKSIYTDEPLTITTADEVIHGVGLYADEDFANYRIKQINGIVNVNEEDGFK